MRAPGIDAETALAPHSLHVILVEDLENEAEAVFHLILPLKQHGRRAGNDDFPGLFPEQQLTGDQPGLDGLPQAHVVGDEEVYPRQQEGLLKGLKLVGVELNSGPKRRLKQAGVGRRHAVPSKCIQVGGEKGR